MNSRRAVLREWYGRMLRLYFVADVHLGSAACDEDKAAELAHIIGEDSFGLAVGLGDSIEAFAYCDKRFVPTELAQPVAPEHLANPFYTQALRFVKIFEATRGKWLCMVTGNHEERATHSYHFDPMAVIAERLGTIYHGGSDCGGWARVRLCDTSGKVRNSIDLFLTHGFGGGELRGGDALKLQRLLLRKQADIVAMGHGHKATVFPEASEMIDPRGYEHCVTRWGIEAYPLVGKHEYLARRGANSSATGYVVASIEQNMNGLARISVEMHEL
jgi:predicted phosphodiesterase